ncbi:MAG: DDE-type integrase/transposase/recombinase [Promethearchaeia archaeon]
MLNYKLEVQFSIDLKEKKKVELYELVKELYFNSGLSIKELSIQFGRSERTIYRWLEKCRAKGSPVSHEIKKKQNRSRKYPQEVFNRIIELKEELPKRSAPMVYSILKREFPNICPSVSTIRKFIRDRGLTFKNREFKQGYIRFQRQCPNDLWQIDIAGVQTVGHLRHLYLIGILDDCSRFIVSAEDFRTQESKNVIKVIRDAIISYGRPNQILADNGRQFRALINDLGTRYSKLLESMDIKPIFSSPNHPQTKGKLERWFGTVKQMFLPEGRNHVNKNPGCSLADFNQKFKEWVSWYNFKKKHRSLPDKCVPAKIYFRKENRIFRPLRAKINWNKWLYNLNQRKVNKCNHISYKGQIFEVPPGYARLKVDIFEYEDKIEIYYKEKLLITHQYSLDIIPKKDKPVLRKIRYNGTISYKGKWYTIDYKLAGKTVEIREINAGKNLLVYLNGILICSLEI